MTAVTKARIGLGQVIAFYLRHTPIRRGRGFVYFRILRGVLPGPPAGYDIRRPGGSRVRLEYREVLGLVAFVEGGFEDAESRLLTGTTRANATAFDVGANIGIHTIPLACSMPSGIVVAVEPLPANTTRLMANAAANGVRNMNVVQAAAGADETEIVLRLANDPAYASTTAVHGGRGTAGELTVTQTTLDRIWEQAGHPPVSVVKIDIEGGELDAIRGARSMLAATRPALLVESQGPERSELVALLGGLGYESRVVDGLEPWNLWFVHDAEPEAPASELGDD